ncbi:hypothetical protein ACIQM4_02530 [Streptomyces sp. NPDC091272]|uniref:hypothetical protein n=1 Tax=Streptomyces sp. NPDC091272 TaxID=3365981 RepID=UPI00381BF5B6
MNHNSIRYAAATALAAVTLGVAAPMASATEAHRAVPAQVSVEQITAADLVSLIAASPAAQTNGEASLTPEALQELQEISEQRQYAGGRVGAAIALLKKSGGLVKAGAKAALGGIKKYNDWVSSLSNWNPVKWALKGLPTAAQYEVYEWLRKQL